MAQYEHLPIYKKAYDLTIYFENTVRNFSRYNKYTLGTELRELSREVMQLIRRANDATDKAPLLLQNRERLEDLKIAVRLCKDVKAFANFNSNERAASIGANRCPCGVGGQLQQW